MDAQQAARLGAQVRQARKRHPWTVRELAEAAGIAPNTVTAIEAGKNVRPGNLRAVLDALGIDPLSSDDSASSADQDIALAQSIIAQWLRRQSADDRREMIRGLMRMVAADDTRPE